MSIFLLMFIARIIYGYTKTAASNNTHHGIQWADRITASSGNIASAKYEMKKSSGSTQNTVKLDQKYEKTANAQLRTEDFEKDEKYLRGHIGKQEAIIQFEQKSGRPGARRLQLQVGVQPERFDEFIAVVREVGQLLSFDVSKKDKTNEYRELNARISTLKATRSSLIELKSKGGKIDEYIHLENRILELDRELQKWGVKLGSFDAEYEFCTVNIALQEGKKIHISLLHRAKVAFEWTVVWYLQMMFGFTLAMLAAWLLVITISKLRKLVSGNASEEHI